MPADSEQAVEIRQITAQMDNKLLFNIKYSNSHGQVVLNKYPGILEIF